MAGTDTIEASSPGLDPAAYRIIVTLPTFRRPEHLLQTLESLGAQETSRPFAVIVMENEGQERAGLAAARPLFEAGRLPGLVLVVPQAGNCNAYNAGWARALSHFPKAEHIAVIDDDEIAQPNWLESLTGAAERFEADLVGGPQHPVFATPRAERYRRHPVFMPPYARSGPVPILFSSGNVLIARRVLERMGSPFLDPMFNFLGGGDSDFYSRCRAQGFRFAWSAEAVVRETMPERRTEFSWLQARGLRNGAISSIIEQRRATSRADRLRSLAKSAALMAAAPARALVLGARTRSAVIGLYPMQVAIGRFQAVCGEANEQYRRPERN